MYVWGDEDAEALTRAYVCQRYLTHCADRGAYPIKFNGSIFTAHMFEELPGNYDRRPLGRRLLDPKHAPHLLAPAGSGRLRSDGSFFPHVP